MGELVERYRRVRAASQALCDALSPEDAQAQSMPEASPAKWHLAHTTWFFETLVLAEHIGGYRDFDPSFRVLFNSYYNSVGEQHPRSERGLLTPLSTDSGSGWSSSDSRAKASRASHLKCFK